MGIRAGGSAEGPPDNSPAFPTPGQADKKRNHVPEARLKLQFFPQPVCDVQP